MAMQLVNIYYMEDLNALKIIMKQLIEYIIRISIKKVHKILEFKQRAWMKPCIDFNTQKRKQATNEPDKNLLSD